MNPQPPPRKRARLGARHQVSLPHSSTSLHHPSFPTRPGSSVVVHTHSGCSLTAENHARRWTGKKLTNQCPCQENLIDILSDDVLLEIFDFCADEDQFSKKEIEAWHSLVHVCRRWRRVVFRSSRRLNLRLACSTKTPVRDTLDVWPALPLLIRDSACLTEGVDNIVAVLERRDRVDRIELFDVNTSPLEKVLAAMQQPFPELTYLLLESYDETVPVLPDSFLGGSAPRLRFFWLNGLPFPGLPKLLLPATHLVHLKLWNIPHSGYISPEAMLNCLSTLTSLEKLSLGFQSPQSCPVWESRRPSLVTRTVLPVLAYFWFKGVSEYFEDLVTGIDAPRVSSLYITFFNQILFDTPQFIQFISRTPTLKALEKACVAFGDGTASFNLSSQTTGYRELNVKIPCRELDWQLSSLQQFSTLSWPLFSTLEDLHIYEAPYSQPIWKDNIENSLWLELLLPFTAVKNLYLSEECAPRIVPALQELVGGGTIEVLPTLQNIFLEGLQPLGPVQEGVGQFVAARQVTGHPIAVSRWYRDRSRIRF